MIIGLTALITFLVSILGAGGYMTDPKFDKHIKEIIEDETRQKSILGITHDFKSIYKSNSHDLASLSKDFVHLSEKKESSKAQFEDALSAIRTHRVKMQADAITARLRIAPEIKPDEWKQLLTKMDQGRDKFIESSNKAFGQIAADLDKTEIAINREIKDETKRNNCKEAFEVYKKEVMDIMSSSIHLNMHEHATLRKLDATETELKQVYDQLNNKRSHLYNTYYEFHEVMASNTDKSEWHAIMKRIKKAYN